jgi:hypothetical protein
VVRPKLTAPFLPEIRMMHQFSKIENLTDLEQRIRDWTSFSDPDVYDFGGLVVLLGAILDNMNAHGIVADYEELNDRLSQEQQAVLRRMVATLCAIK